MAEHTELRCTACNGRGVATCNNPTCPVCSDLAWAYRAAVRCPECNGTGREVPS
jgi:hypothetical protein